MKVAYENDGEYVNFLEEMREEYPKLLALVLKHSIPDFIEIDSHILQQMVKDRRQMAALLREFIARNPKDEDLARRAQPFL